MNFIAIGQSDKMEKTDKMEKRNFIIPAFTNGKIFIWMIEIALLHVLKNCLNKDLAKY